LSTIGGCDNKLREHLSRRLRRKRQATRQQEVRDRRETVLIRERTDQLTGQRFRRDVHQRADEEARARQTLLGRMSVSVAMPKSSSFTAASPDRT
jgi:hypothetical protein